MACRHVGRPVKVLIPVVQLRLASKLHLKLASAARPATKLSLQPSHHDSLAACARRLFCWLSSHSCESINVTQARFHSLLVSPARIPSLSPPSSFVLCDLLEAASIHPPSLSLTCRLPSTSNARSPGAASYLASTNRDLCRKRPTPASIRRLCSRAPDTSQTRATGSRAATMATAGGHAEDERRRGREVLPALLGFWRLFGGV